VFVERLDHAADQRMVARRQGQQIRLTMQVLAQVGVGDHQVHRARLRFLRAIAHRARSLQPTVVLPVRIDIGPALALAIAAAIDGRFGTAVRHRRFERGARRQRELGTRLV
jgi:hypothetical protein